MVGPRFKPVKVAVSSAVHPMQLKKKSGNNQAETSNRLLLIREITTGYDMQNTWDFTVKRLILSSQSPKFHVVFFIFIKEPR